MKIIKQRVEFLDRIDGAEMARRVEIAGRTCYKSEVKISETSAERFVRNLIKHGHEAMVEHVGFSVRFTTSRAIANEIVRHRMASFAQVSTRYVDYGKAEDGDIDFVLASEDMPDKEAEEMQYVCARAEKAYHYLRRSGVSPQIARDILPMALATELVMTANMREWRHFLKLRSAPDAHPHIRELAKMILHELKEKAPVFVEDIELSPEE